MKVIESFLYFIMCDFYSFVFLSDLSVWFGQLDCFIFSEARVHIVATKGKTMGFDHIGWSYSVYIIIIHASLYLP